MAAKKTKSIEKIVPAIELPRGFKFPKINKDFLKKNLAIILIIAAVLGLAIFKKHWFVAATVNGVPVSNLEVLGRLNREYRTEVLETIVSEKIILSEARKKGAIPSESEVNDRMKELEEKQFGGAEAFDAFLEQQNQTRATIKELVKIQLAIEKMYATEATVSDEEVAEFITQYKDQFQASDEAGQKEEARDAIKQRKLSQIFSEKLEELKKNAQVKIF